ncbi:MAG: glycosyltransferase, partial [Vicinamibacterales bacterium]
MSVVIAAHNAGRTIDAALASVASQTLRGVGALVVDDGSTDDTVACASVPGQDVICCRQAHAGLTPAWNTGLQCAQGDILVLLEPTDVLLPRALDRIVRYFRTWPETALVLGDTVAAHSPSARLLDLADRVPLESAAAPAAAGFRGIGSPLRLSALAIRRDVALAMGPLDTTLPPDAAWREWCERLASSHSVGRVEAPLAAVRAVAPHDAAATTAVAPPRDLLQDTLYRRARASLASAAHTLDASLLRRSSGPLRILFEAASPMSVAVFGPVLTHLQRDGRLEFWFTSSDRSWDTTTLFASAGITTHVLDASTIRWSQFDGYVNTDFWNMTWLPRRTRRMHFFHGVAGKYGLDAPVRIAPVVSTFDRLLFPNRDRLRRYTEAGLIDADSPQAALIGYPKVDCLVDGSLDRTSTLASIDFDESRPTVLYAPTWSPYSSLNTMGHDVVAALGRLDVNVIVKLHDRSYAADTRGSGGIDWKTGLERICTTHGARLVQDADASPWLHAADLLVTDHSSVGFEFMLLDRPIVVLDSPGLLAHARVNPDKVAMLRRAAFVAYDRDQIRSTVLAALDAPHAHRDDRRAVSNELFYCPGSA